MDKPLKAALLSALLLPGLGHLYLRKWIRGGLLAAAALGALYVLIARTAQRALVVAGEVQRSAAPLTIDEVSKMMSDRSSVDIQGVNWALVVLAVTWLVGIIDSYRIGRTTR